MTAILASIEPLSNTARPDTEALGRQITELCGYLYAATYRLLVLIREFDEHGTAYHVETLVSKYRRCKRLEDLENANRQHTERRVSYHFDADGCLVLNARLPAEPGALIVKALEMAIELATGEDVSAETPDGPADREPIAARRADALAAIAETYMNTGPVAAATADRYQVVVHVNQDSLRDDTRCGDVTAETSGDSDAERTHIENGPHVSAETSRRIACDCSTVRVMENGRGEPLSIGRKSRAIPPAIRRALRLRDRGCRFPGCTHTRFVDGHHVKHWADGGETRLDNLVLLCRRHHRLVHEGGYGCERAADGGFVFTAPDRAVLPGHEPLPGLILDRDPTQWFGQAMAELEIDADTCVPAWYAGETMDWDMAVSALFASPA